MKGGQVKNLTFFDERVTNSKYEYALNSFDFRMLKISLEYLDLQK